VLFPDLDQQGIRRARAGAHRRAQGALRRQAHRPPTKRPPSTCEGRPLIDKWTFSTNGVAIQGRYGIPCVGFGPGAESQAHAPNEITWKQDLVTCAALYAAVPDLYKPENEEDVCQFRAGGTGNDINKRLLTKLSERARRRTLLRTP
jgi:hypothetical protein